MTAPTSPDGPLPCPFCGGVAKLIKGPPGCAFVRCETCKASGDDRLADSAIAAWNRRAPPASPVQGVEPVAWPQEEIEPGRFVDVDPESLARATPAPEPASDVMARARRRLETMADDMAAGRCDGGLLAARHLKRAIPGIFEIDPASPAPDCELDEAVRGLQHMLDGYAGKTPYEGFPKALRAGINAITALRTAPPVGARVKDGGDLEARLAAAKADNRRLIGNAKAQGILDDIGAAGKSRAKQARHLAFKIGEQRKEIRRLKECLAAAEAGEDALAEALDEMLDEYGANIDNECRLKGYSELAMIDRSRAALAAYEARRKG